jgi:cytochrome c oxidase cbb3-type subunit 3
MSADDEKMKIPGHNPDGIEELDYPVPWWFQMLFYVTIVFGSGYWAYYELGPGVTLVEEYERVKQADEVTELTRLAGTKKVLASDDELAALLKNSERKQKGQTAYASKCASCHGAQGQGGIGPNLTDKHWIHGGKLSQILATVVNGVPDKGMPGWGPLMSAEDSQDLVLFVRSIAGTNPPGAKAPQGELMK